LSGSSDFSALDAFRARVDARAAGLAARHAQRLQCRRGCSACCLDDITVFTVEADVIRERHAELLRNEAPRAAGACAFLDAEGACRIYENRPYVCRTHGLPIAWVEERSSAEGEADFVELRDICHLNEAGEPLEELAPEDCWRVGAHEAELRRIQESHAGTLARVPLRSLFQRAPLCEGEAERAFAVALREIEAGATLHESLRAAWREGEPAPERRALVREALRLALHHEGRVRAALPRLLPAHWPRALHVGSLLFAGMLDLARARTHCPAVVWEDMLARDAQRRADPDPVRSLSQTGGIPPFLAARMLAEYGEEALRHVRGWQQRPARALRVNTLAMQREELLASLSARGIRGAPGAFAPQAIVLEAEHEYHRWPEFERGAFELQDEASQLVAELVAVPARALVIDWCAGAGGKTLALGAAMGNRGRLLALDRNQRRLAELKRRCARAGVQNFSSFVTPRPGAALHPELERALAKSARVLVDVPCSGLGSLRRKPELLRKLDEPTLERLPREQLAIAREAARFVAPGGRLIYTTCTLLAAENEGVVEALLADGGWRLIPAAEVLGGVLAAKCTGTDGRFLRMHAHLHGTDGFFGAVLERLPEKNV
jgi:16S rRNA (cytosine967-C5)-methyltransferase